MAEAPNLRSAIESGLDRGANRVIADLTDVTYLDSTGIAVLIGCARDAEASGGRFIVVASDPQVLRVFDVTGLRDMVRLEPSLDKAMNGMSPESS